MAEPKVVLFYCFTPQPDPEAIRLWQITLCQSLDLKGRIIISPHGINAAVGGDLKAVKRYLRATKSYLPYKNIDVKWSVGEGNDFPRLSVKVRPELVAFGAPDEVVVTSAGVEGGGTHLSPQQLHELVEARGDEVIFFDGRNAFEAEVGKFRNAIIPDVKTSHDFVAEIESGKYDDLKDKPVVTYCTGGIRCEVLSALMKTRGFNEVYQLEGGIIRYGEAFGDSGLWEGSLVVFDERMVQTFSEDPKVISHCEACGAPTTNYVNCGNLVCRALLLLCPTCVDAGAGANCSPSHAGRR
ncbi:MAG: rhodanese-related sulfurtransferase [Actinomycetota bacterium]